KNGNLDFYEMFESPLFNDYTFTKEDKIFVIEESFKRLDENLSLLTDKRKRLLMSLKINDVIKNSSKTQDKLKAIEIYIKMYNLDNVSDEDTVLDLRFVD